jgi:hypothetical protein
MTTGFLSTFFIAIISTWATWSVLSDRVRDGIVGKLIYAAIALAGYAIVTRAESIYITPTVAGVTFHASLAMAGVRHIFMVTWWDRVKHRMCRYLRCEHCLSRDNRRVKIERRKQ